MVCCRERLGGLIRATTGPLRNSLLRETPLRYLALIAAPEVTAITSLRQPECVIGSIRGDQPILISFLSWICLSKGLL